MKSSENTIDRQSKNFLLYTSREGDIKVNVLLENETIWLSQKSMAELFHCSTDNISLHLKNIFKTGELVQDSVVEVFSVTATDGKKYKVNHYNIDAIISVGYRVNSIRGTQFRIWATQQLKELIIKGFVIDDARLKNPENPFGADYFEELEERIRDIRTSERRFYQKITDVYATSVDYNRNAELTKNFFATVQNKLHFGIHGKTAAELIAQRADSSKKNMGMTSISEKSIKKSDIFIAKNYLTKSEISELNLIVEQYLAFATLQAKRKKQMTMKDWILKLDDFLQLNEKEILLHRGKISKKLADEMVEKEYTIFKKEYLKNYESDFDKATKLFLAE